MIYLTNIPLDLGLRATRMEPPENLKISARTLGTKLAFEIPVSNISRTGLMLVWNNGKLTLPFIENTLIEIELKTTIRGENRQITCMGKVVRKSKESHGAVYGIKVIHNDDQEHIEWMTIITTFEKTQPHI